MSEPLPAGRTFPEALCFWTLVLTWPLYAIGGLYVAGPVLVWSLAGLAALALYLGPALGPGFRATGPVPTLCYLWLAGMLTLLVALWIAYVQFALEEKSRFFRGAGIVAGLAMILLSASRMSLVALAVCTMVPRLMPFLAQSVAWRLAAVVAASMAILGDLVLGLVDDSIRSFKEARASSSRVRATLQEIAFQRWWSEAVWFGHGEVERGPHIVEYMPIGSHHTWYGLLFVKGIVGVFALAIPLVCHFLVTAFDAVRGPRGRLPFGLMLQIVILTFGENLEIEVYLFWPGFLLLGIHLREMARDTPA